MNRKQCATRLAVAATFAVCSVVVHAENTGTRTELSRAPLESDPSKEVIVATTEWKPGQGMGRHSHHGTEVSYFLTGAKVDIGGTPAEVTEGQTRERARGEEHGGFTVAGDKPFKMLSVHIVDKGKPLTVWTK